MGAPRKEKKEERMAFPNVLLLLEERRPRIHASPRRRWVAQRNAGRREKHNIGALDWTSVEEPEEEGDGKEVRGLASCWHKLIPCLIPEGEAGKGGREKVVVKKR